MILEREKKIAGPYGLVRLAQNCEYCRPMGGSRGAEFLIFGLGTNKHKKSWKMRKKVHQFWSIYNKYHRGEESSPPPMCAIWLINKTMYVMTLKQCLELLWKAFLKNGGHDISQIFSREFRGGLKPELSWIDLILTDFSIDSKLIR
jgi:hypothetical protein